MNLFPFRKKNQKKLADGGLVTPKELPEISFKFERQAMLEMEQAILNGRTWNFSFMEPQPKLPESLSEESVVAAVCGWRRWFVGMFGDELRSFHAGEVWMPYQRMTAKCEEKKVCHGLNCGCGLYAWKERSGADGSETYPTQPLRINHVLGEVFLWGRIIECEKGYRAQYAYPKAFMNTGGIAQCMAYLYGVKLIEPETAKLKLPENP